MTIPVKKSFCLNFCSCFYAQPLNKKPKEPVSQTQFQAAIGNYHRKIASTDILSDRQFINWNDASYQNYLKERKENK